MNNQSNTTSHLREVLLLVAGCVSIFLCVFYSDAIKTTVGTEIANYWAKFEQQSASSDVTDQSQSTSASSTVERSVFLRADRHNQFYADAYIDGRRINVLVDTGASHVSLRNEDAERLGIRLSDRDFTATARTANGTTRIAPVRLDKVRIGEVTVRDVQAFVGEEGASFATLLGMSFLRKLSRMNISGRQLELVQ